jgi:hypothetical protein
MKVLGTVYGLHCGCTYSIALLRSLVRELEAAVGGFLATCICYSPMRLLRVGRLYDFYL